jgi:predicted O-methyltransferase YrrM
MADATLHVTEAVSSPASDLVGLMQTAFRDALAGAGPMNPEVYDVGGFCGRKFRLFLNNLVGGCNGTARYLEVGVFRGATLCAALSGNAVAATAIDDWSWDTQNDVARECYANLARFKSSRTPVTLIEKDFRRVPSGLIGSFNIYFYDGAHEEQDQYDGAVWAYPALDDHAILLVDDWNWPSVRAGTLRALRDLDAVIEYSVELRTSFNDEIPGHAFGGSDWHNGFFGAVISKARRTASP